MDFNINFLDVVGQRGTYRAAIPGLSVRLASGKECVARDLSAGGVGLIPPEGVFLAAEQELVLDMLVAGKLYIQALEAVVVRVTPAAVACSFRRLNRVQESRLDKLVLETQKRLIARRKAQEAEQEALRQEALRQEQGDSHAEGDDADKAIKINLI